MTSREDLSLVTKCPQQLLSKFCHGVIDEMCKHKGNSYQDFGDVWTLEEWWQVNEAFRDIVKASGKDDLEKEKVMELLSPVQDGVCEEMLNAIMVRKSDIRQALLSSTNEISQSTLTDFDWQVKLALSSDKMGSLNEPLVNLHLDIAKDNEQKQVSIELDKEELKKLKTALEAANKVVQQYTT